MYHLIAEMSNRYGTNLFLQKVLVIDSTLTFSTSTVLTLHIGPMRRLVSLCSLFMLHTQTDILYKETYRQTGGHTCRVAFSKC